MTMHHQNETGHNRKRAPTAASASESIAKTNKHFVIKHEFKLGPASEPDLYPHCDARVWLRSCVKEVIEPLHGDVKGDIPKWLNGSLLRNGPGSLKMGGKTVCTHLFDSYAMLHKFRIKDGNVTYQCRFIHTDSYKNNSEMISFGSRPVADPCQTIFQRVASIFQPAALTDNTMISIYPFGDEYYAFTECPVIQRINVNTLETVAKLDVTQYTSLLTQTSHPFIMNDGTVFNLGMSMSAAGAKYSVVCFPNGHQMFDNAYVVGTQAARWRLHPSYMHTFGITKNYFIIVEQPLSISVVNSLRVKVMKAPMASSFKWFGNEDTVFYLLCRETGQLQYTFHAEAFFFLHVINAFEADNCVVIDICCYKDPGMLDCMYIEAMENMQRLPDYAKMFRGKPLRFVLPLNVEKRSPKSTGNPTNDNAASGAASKSIECDEEHHGNNLITLRGAEAEAYLLADKKTVFCVPECLCDLGCETPRINYENKLGKQYRYFYAISSDVDALNPGTLIKVDVETKTRRIWCEPNCYPSEPVFVPSVDAQSEDDGVVLSALIWGHDDENRVGLLVLCAKTFQELGRCEFTTPGPVPKCLHGWFAPSKE